MAPQPLVLLVDDEPDLLAGVGATLRASGFRVRTATDGDAALRTFAAESPALVVLDLMLPARDGLDVCRELRRQSDVPILMLTAPSGTGSPSWIGGYAW